MIHYGQQVVFMLKYLILKKQFKLNTRLKNNVEINHTGRL